MGAVHLNHRIISRKTTAVFELKIVGDIQNKCNFTNMDNVVFRIKKWSAAGCLVAAAILSACTGQSRGPDAKAEFPGGTSKMYAYLMRHMKYPEDAIKRNASFGRTIISFTVKTDGTLDEFSITEDPGFGMGDQLVRVVKNMPKWYPAKKSGKLINSKYILPLFVDPE